MAFQRQSCPADGVDDDNLVRGRDGLRGYDFSALLRQRRVGTGPRHLQGQVGKPVAETAQGLVQLLSRGTISFGVRPATRSILSTTEGGPVADGQLLVGEHAEAAIRHAVMRQRPIWLMHLARYCSQRASRGTPVRPGDSMTDASHQFSGRHVRLTDRNQESQ